MTVKTYAKKNPRTTAGDMLAKQRQVFTIVINPYDRPIAVNHTDLGIEQLLLRLDSDDLVFSRARIVEFAWLRYLPPA